jgi:hypothetical protein
MDFGGFGEKFTVYGKQSTVKGGKGEDLFPEALSPLTERGDLKGWIHDQVGNDAGTKR